jgi:putative ABC transport system permease protein
MLVWGAAADPGLESCDCIRRLFAVIIGIALLTPVATLGLMNGFQRLVRGRLGVIGRMAHGTIVRSLSRTSVAIAALMVAVSVIIGVGVMVSSFRNTVVLWLDDILQADIYISPPNLNSNQIRSAFGPELAVRGCRTARRGTRGHTRSVDVVAYANAIDDRMGEGTGGEVVEETIPVRLVSFSEDLAGERRRYRQSVGDWAETWAAMEAGGIIINEPMSNRYGLTVGDDL